MKLSTSATLLVIALAGTFGLTGTSGSSQSNPNATVDQIEGWLSKTYADNPVHDTFEFDEGSSHVTYDVWLSAPRFDGNLVRLRLSKYRTGVWQVNRGQSTVNRRSVSDIALQLNSILLSSVRKVRGDATSGAECTPTHQCHLSEPGVMIETIGDKIEISEATEGEEVESSGQTYNRPNGKTDYVCHSIFLPVRSEELATRMTNAWSDLARLSGAKDVKPNLY